MRKTIIVKTVEGIDRNALNDLFDKMQDLKGVYSVTVPNLGPDPDQLPLWPDEPAEQKLLPVPTHEQKMQAVRETL